MSARDGWALAREALMGIQRAQAVIERGDSGRAWMVLEDVAHGIREALAAEELERGADRGSEVGVMDERVERVARELHAMDHEVSDACKPWEDAHQDAYREMAARVLRVADAPQVPDEAVGGLMEGIERTGGADR